MIQRTASTVRAIVYRKIISLRSKEGREQVGKLKAWSKDAMPFNQTTWNYGNKFVPEVIDILSRRTKIPKHEFEVAPSELDRKEVTDLICRNKRVSVRIRNHSYLLKFPNDITFRATAQQGLSEWEKVRDE